MGVQVETAGFSETRSVCLWVPLDPTSDIFLARPISALLPDYILRF